MSEDALDAAAEAEAALAVEQVWGVASRVEEVGARLSFTFWAERGALTLLGHEARVPGGHAGRSVDAERTRDALRTVLGTYARRRTGAVTLRLTRDTAGWSVDYAAGSDAPCPSEARSWPVRREGLPAETVGAVTKGLDRVLQAVQVPPGGAASVELEARMEDGRVEGWALRSFQVTRPGTGGQPVAVSRRVTGEAAGVLLPFTQGIGARGVLLRLSLVHQPGDAQARGTVEDARVVRPPLPPGMSEDFAAEYRAMHEDILRRWREDVAEGFAWVAQRGAEELTLWYAGGVLAKGASVLVGATVGTVFRALGRGSKAASGWLRTMLVRLSREEKVAFDRLWSKFLLEGEAALSRAEHNELRALMVRIEQLSTTVLGREEKLLLRQKARALYSSAHPEVTAVLKEQAERFPIHHRRPLQYAHLFPTEDANALDNLAMVQVNAHLRINVLWDKIRRARPQVTADEVKAAARHIDAQFQPWYDRIDAPSASLKSAEEAALQALRRLFPGLE